MNIYIHALLFTLAAGVLWVLSGILIDATDRVAHRYRKPGFAIAFLLLGLLTSISEMSVATNATLAGVPQVSAGNLLGASTVIFLFIMPLLAVFGGGIRMGKTVAPKTMILLLGVVLLPAMLSLDGTVTRNEGILMLLLYGALVFRIQKKQSPEVSAKKALAHTHIALFHHRHATMMDLGKILLGAVIIFIAGNFLVTESVYFAGRLSIPVSFIGLLILSIGTNIPELVIAMRCILGKHKDIAFGDYTGSAAANTLLFGFLPLFNGNFTLEQSEVSVTCGILAVGLIFFFIFSRTKNTLSQKEGICLLLLYVLFLFTQIGNAFRVSTKHLPLEAMNVEMRQ